jgi:outer membrane lipoprotein-sorting protein
VLLPVIVLVYTTMMRFIITVLLFSLLSLQPLSVAAEPRAQVLGRVEKYLSSINTIVADFSQIAPSGALSTGKFYLKRPKQMRWQYNPPTPILMVTRGEYLTYYDYELNQVSDIPLQDTLLGFLSQKQISFADKAVKVTDFEQEPGIIRITLVQSANPDDGALMLEFSDKPLRLYNMRVTDSTGQTTSIALNNARFDVTLNNKTFEFKDPRIGGKRTKAPKMR